MCLCLFSLKLLKVFTDCSFFMPCNLHNFCWRYIILTELLNQVLLGTMVKSFLLEGSPAFINICFITVDIFVHPEWLPFEPYVGQLYTSQSSTGS